MSLRCAGALPLSFALAASLALGACGGDSSSGGAGGRGGDVPQTCDLGCPNGFRCDEGVCAGGDQGAVELDLRTVAVSGKLLLDGVAPVVSEGCFDYTVELRFVERSTGSSTTHLVPCGAAAFDFAVTLTRGTWTVLASKYRAEDSNLPEGTFVVHPALEVAEPVSGLLLDLRTVRVSGHVTHDGAAPEVTPECFDYSTELMFEETSTGALVWQRIPCDSTDFAFEAVLQPGTWAARIMKYRDDASSLPDGMFEVHAGLAVAAPTTGVALDLRTVPVAGHVRLNGAAPVVSPGCDDYTLRVRFEGVETGTSVSTLLPCNATGFDFAAHLPPGTYSVRVSKVRDYAVQFPDGERVVAPALEVSGPVDGLELDLRTVRVAGRVTLNGAAPTAGAGCADYSTTVTFVETSTGSSASELVPCSVSDHAFAIDLQPGRYAALVSGYRDGATNLPPGTFVVNPSLEVDGPAEGVQLELRTARVAGRVRLDGAVPAVLGGCSDRAATVYLREGRPIPTTWSELFGGAPASFASVDVPCGTQDFEWALDVPPGDYLVAVSGRAGATNLPDGAFTLIRRLEVR